VKPGDIFSDFNLNIAARCRAYRIGLWQCPDFLFVVMGIIIVITIVATHITASVYTEPEIVVTIIFIATIVLFSIGHIVVRAFERVAEASRLKSEFVSIISHELRNPPVSIKWQLDMLFEGGMSHSVEEWERTGMAIKQANEHMIRLINDLLDVNRIEDNVFELSPTTFSLNEVTMQMVEEVGAYAKASGLHIVVLSPKTQFLVRADRYYIKSVISRFIDNAIRYSPTHGEITITLEDLTSAVRWSIADQGVGIPAEEVKRIFSRFFRAKNILRYQTKGLGVGLYISKYIIEASGGTIGFRTLEGRGSTFFFTLPRAK